MSKTFIFATELIQLMGLDRYINAKPKMTHCYTSEFPTLVNLGITSEDTFRQLEKMGY